MPDKDSILIIWIKLLVQAGKCNALHGVIFLNETLPYTDEMLSTIFNRPLNTVRLALNTFLRFGMIEIYDDGKIKIVNWEKHQNVKGLDQIREQTRKRVAKHRECKKLLKNVTPNVTLRNAIDIERDIERDIEKDIYSARSNPDFLKLAQDFHDYQKKQFPNLVSNDKSAIKNSVKGLDELTRIDKHDLELIRAALGWGVKDDFWASQLRSIGGLRRKSGNGSTKFENLVAAFYRERQVSKRPDSRQLQNAIACQEFLNED
jgi:predicted phage replisome organizer